MENNNKKVVYVSGNLGGYPGLEPSQEYPLFAKLYNEGYTHVQDGDEGALWVSTHPLPTVAHTNQEGQVWYWMVDVEETFKSLEGFGFEVSDLEDVHPDFIPEPNERQLSYKR